MSFKEDYWIGHLNVPPTPKSGALKRASMFVLLTRWASMDHVHLLAPLWPPDATDADIDKIVHKYWQATKVDPALAAEVQRLQAAATITRAKLHA
mmetsp:Transcript_39085/g.86959  ORF Transcript_39085/g.86959 Transcript_39085/m.86959 type:complete len:95 (+) Transcript_39085:3-287(+)